MNAAEKREQRLVLLEDHIGRALAESAASGELRTAPSYGRPLQFGDGYDETPDALKMPFKVLKDAGIVPREVELMRRIAALQQQLQARGDGDAVGDADGARADRQRLAEMQQALSLWLEKLRLSGSL